MTCAPSLYDVNVAANKRAFVHVREQRVLDAVGAALRCALPSTTTTTSGDDDKRFDYAAVSITADAFHCAQVKRFFFWVVCLFLFVFIFRFWFVNWSLQSNESYRIIIIIILDDVC